MRHDNDMASGGGWCPSCRLEVHKGSGRLRWSVRSRREDSGWHQKKRMRLMLAALMVLLPVGLVLGVISQLYVKHRKTEAQSLESTKHDFQDNQLSYDPERMELEDRDLMQDMRTQFVQPVSAFYSIRNRRNTVSADEINTWDTYQGNVTSDVIIWDVNPGGSNTGALNGAGQIISSTGNQFNPFIKKIAKISNFDTSNTGNKNKSALHSIHMQITVENSLEHTKSPQISIPQEHSSELQVSSPSPEERNNVNNQLLDKYLNDEINADYGIIEVEEREEDTQYSEPEIVKEDAVPWKTTVVEGDDHQTGGGEETLEIPEEEFIVEDEPDFLTFWKYEGDSEAIRNAQAKLMMSYMDTNADPCQDFYQYACGNWGKKNPIPKDKAAYDTFEMLRENLDIVLKELLEEETNVVFTDSDTNFDTNDATVKVRNFYKSCMNYEILEERAEHPLVTLLDQLGGWPVIRPDWDASQFDWIALMAQLRLYNNDILISEWVGPDIKNSDEYVIQFDQTSLGLPTRDYFLQSSNLKYLQAYKSFLIKISTLLGAPLDNATQQAEEIIDFEIKLAKITSSPDERRNVSELYQRMTVGELRQYIPQVDWYQYLSLVLARPVNISEPVVVFALKYIEELVDLVENTPPRTTANYLLWRFIRHRINNLDDRFQDVKQKFYQILFGREEAPPRWKNCISQVNTHLGMALGAMFVRKHFDENSKNDTIQMTEEIMQSFEELLNDTNWIDPETKKLAAEKVNAMMLRIGYPDFILNPELLNARYENLEIYPDLFFENTLNILKHLTRTEQDHLGTPVNKTVWNTAPAVVNAYYSRNKNQIMFPAGILQPPFYHRYFPRSLNYGGIGVVVGHEITHGFDDKGRLFDKAGNLHRWWHDEAIDAFHRRAQCLVDQYNTYTVQEVAMQVDGMNTQGENIADNGGIKQAFKAYQKWLDENGNVNETLPGLNATGHQLFFLNFAQIWCGSMRPEATRNKLKTAVHSPGKFRVIGTLSNSEDFASVYNCEEGTLMNPKNKCSVW